jgi:hypothetical protein
MPDISTNLGLNLPKGSDTFDYDVFLRQNFSTLDEKVGYLLSELALSGTTAARPTTNNYVGRRYWDTSLQKPVFWTGSTWKDSTGTTA